MIESVAEGVWSFPGCQWTVNNDSKESRMEVKRFRGESRSYGARTEIEEHLGESDARRRTAERTVERGSTMGEPQRLFELTLIRHFMV